MIRDSDKRAARLIRLTYSLPDTWLPGMSRIIAEEREKAEKCFKPTPTHINALPKPLRNYIHDLETRYDPAGEVAELVLTQDQNKMLQEHVKAANARIAELENRCDIAAQTIELMTKRKGCAECPKVNKAKALFDEIIAVADIAIKQAGAVKP